MRELKHVRMLGDRHENLKLYRAALRRDRAAKVKKGKGT